MQDLACLVRNVKLLRGNLIVAPEVSARQEGNTQKDATMLVQFPHTCEGGLLPLQGTYVVQQELLGRRTTPHQ